MTRKEFLQFVEVKYQGIDIDILYVEKHRIGKEYQHFVFLNTNADVPRNAGHWIPWKPDHFIGDAMLYIQHQDTEVWGFDNPQDALLFKLKYAKT